MNKKKILIAVIGVGILGGVAYSFRSKEKTKTIYEDISVTRENMSVSVLATGTVSPENRLEIKSPIAGRAEEIVVKEGANVRKGQILAWMSSTERAALLDAARAKGEAEVKQWEDLYRPTPVISPINGTVILKNVEAGQTFTSTDVIFALSNRLTVKAQVDETDIASIKVNQKAEIILDAYSDSKIEAVVTAIAYDATIVNNVTTYVVDVAPKTTPDFMRSGMTANVNFSISTRENVLAVPVSTIEITELGSTVLMRNAEGKRVTKAVKTGLSDGKMIEVTEGLADGDIVLLKQLSTDSDSKSTNPFSPMGPRGKKR